MKKAMLFPVVVTLALLGGCGKEDGKKAATQVAAKVNGDEITIHQVNAALSRTNVPADQADAAKRRALERLIDQHIVKQQAIEKKLDRTPRVVQAIEAAKNEILARAYLEQVSSAQPKVAPEDVKKYYAEHPELFAERRIYNIEEVTIVDGDTAGAKQQAGKTRDLAELANWLKSQNVKFTANRGVRAAEQLPLEWLPQLHKLKDGETRTFEAGDRLTVLRVVATRSAPVDEAAAAKRIEQFLFNRRLTEAMRDELKHLREKSNIEYAGEFAGGAKPKPEPETFQPEQPEPAAAPAGPNFEKAIRGLR